MNDEAPVVVPETKKEFDENRSPIIVLMKCFVYYMAFIIIFIMPTEHAARMKAKDEIMFSMWTELGALTDVITIDQPESTHAHYEACLGELASHKGIREQELLDGLICLRDQAYKLNLVSEDRSMGVSEAVKAYNADLGMSRILGRINLARYLFPYEVMDYPLTY
jgi:hypothetical protein